MKVLITGITGFVGTNLVSYIRNYGLETIGASRKSDSTSEFIKYDEITRDMIDRKQISVIVHLAGKAHDTIQQTDEATYFEANTILTQKLYEEFLLSGATTFIYMSSVKAIADNPGDALVDEGYKEISKTNYGKSKKIAEEYILMHQRSDKRVFILRPCMIHGPGNKGNLNLLYRMVRKGLPYPLAAFENKRSFLSIDNLCFVIYEMISRKDISSGIYNVCDDEPVSTNTLIQIMSDSLGKTTILINIPKGIIKCIAAVGDRIPLPLNTERLKKLTDNYLVNNNKLKGVLQKPLPVSAFEGLKKTVESFKDAS